MGLAVVVCLIILVADLRGAIGFSSFGVLLYYFIANAATYTQTVDRRLYPKAVQILGALGCVILLATLPALSITIALAILIVGLLCRGLRLHRRKQQTPSP